MIHSSNTTLIEGAVFDGAYEGAYRVATAAQWLARYAHNHRACIAIRRARNGAEGAAFRDDSGVVWNLRAASASAS
jgi:hypothetical protein